MKLELVSDEVELPWRPTPEWERRLQGMVAAFGPRDGLLQVVLTDDETLRQHNRDYRGKDSSTDVLSFSYLRGHEGQRRPLLAGEHGAAAFLDEPVPDGEEALVGQLLLSLPYLRERGPVHTGDEQEEALFFVAHGLLHVLGFDHEDEAGAAEMEELEPVVLAASRAAGGAA